ncbi:hypothetical protein GOV12_05440 [Candidatus Pacearchaeota archaeon]|nr:hypothetical protein [Candidatus Pacearchaeota archaeon]
MVDYHELFESAKSILEDRLSDFDCEKNMRVDFVQPEENVPYEVRVRQNIVEGSWNIAYQTDERLDISLAYDLQRDLIGFLREKGFKIKFTTPWVLRE